MNRTTTTRNARRGFTIIEVMIVLVIIGVIGGIVGLNLIGAAQQSRVQATEQTMQTVRGALKLYYTQNGKYPESSSWLSDIQNSLNAPAEDAWGNPLVYQQMNDGAGFVIYSDGADGVAETDDDIELGPDHE